MSLEQGTVRKIMSATEAEFAQSLAVLLGRTVSLGELPLRLAVGAGYVVITREAMPGVRLGGLLEMPRAAVTLSFDAVPAPDRAHFLHRFDLAFQRGGG